MRNEISIILIYLIYFLSKRWVHFSEMFNVLQQAPSSHEEPLGRAIGNVVVMSLQLRKIAQVKELTNATHQAARKWLPLGMLPAILWPKLWGAGWWLLHLSQAAFQALQTFNWDVQKAVDKILSAHEARSQKDLFVVYLLLCLTIQIVYLFISVVNRCKLLQIDVNSIPCFHFDHAIQGFLPTVPTWSWVHRHQWLLGLISLTEATKQVLSQRNANPQARCHLLQPWIVLHSTQPLFTACLMQMDVAPGESSKSTTFARITGLSQLCFCQWIAWWDRCTQAQVAWTSAPSRGCHMNLP